ncbi:hypothetical protein B0H14DRAFT_3506970 [Mycena olivaceomarginata]|nr:hypothetical protein B0H14DRAFT_3506970 [Mycena olivaceomarginata]
MTGPLWDVIRVWSRGLNEHQTAVDGTGHAGGTGGVEEGDVEAQTQNVVFVHSINGGTGGAGGAGGILGGVAGVGEGPNIHADTILVENLNQHQHAGRQNILQWAVVPAQLAAPLPLRAVNQILRNFNHSLFQRASTPSGSKDTDKSHGLNTYVAARDLDASSGPPAVLQVNRGELFIAAFLLAESYPPGYGGLDSRSERGVILLSRANSHHSSSPARSRMTDLHSQYFRPFQSSLICGDADNGVRLLVYQTIQHALLTIPH